MPRQRFRRPYVVLVTPVGDELEMYSTYLEASGYVVQAFRQSNAALHSVRRHAPDALVTRIRQQQGNVDGLELVAQLRASRDTKDVPALIISTSIDPRDRVAATEVGCSAFMTLPITPDQLVRQLDANLAIDAGAPVKGDICGTPINE
jgi:CheY-like chemotaxis protein